MVSDILIVDDEDDIRELVSEILTDEGHGTRVARDSDEALAAIEARRPQLVLLDIWLQGRGSTACSCSRRQAAASQRAGGHDLGSRQHRDRGLRDQAGRL